MYTWIDLETTGLDPKYDIILEVGLRITDAHLTTLAEQSWVVGIEEELVQHIDEFVVNMHTSSGLLDECIASLQAPHRIEQEAIDFLKDHKAQKEPMAGSSVHFDRSFLRAHMENLHDTFHYRNIDVSTVKNLARIHAPQVLEEWEEMNSVMEKPHRALDDLDLSIKELRFYLRSMQVGGWWKI